MRLFSIQNAHFSRRNTRSKINVLSDINMEIEGGDVVCVLGKNGSGKTTLIKCILGLLKWDSGEVMLKNRDFRAYKNDIWNIISYVPQAKSNILNLKVLDMVALGLNTSIYFVPRKEHYAQAHAILERLNLTKLAPKNCCNLSGGEFQMVLFARALVRNPEILVLDEPESNLDFANQKIILDSLKMLSANGTTIILNTHFPAHAMFLANKCMLLYKQENDFSAIFGAARELLSEENLSRLYNVPLRIHATIARKEDSSYMIRI